MQNRRLIDDRIAGDLRYYFDPAPDEIDMRIPDRVLQCVGFIAHDTPNPKYGATGFVVAFQDTALAFTYYYFVTAKHVAEKIEPGSFLVALSGKNRKFVPIIRSAESLQWWYHPTDHEHVDVAVTLFNPPSDLLDISTIMSSMFVSDDAIKYYSIGVGDEVNVVGLFTRFSGTTTHSPILRTGNIAMMPSEPIPTKDFGPMQVYLIEGRSIGGLSGSPVFVRNTVHNVAPNASKGGEKITMFGLGNFHFLGLVHGHWELPLDYDFKATEQAEAVNMGISIVVPAKKILEVINHPELVEMRKQLDTEARRPNLPTTDSELEKKPPVFTKEDFEAALKKVSRKKTD